MGKRIQPRVWSAPSMPERSAQVAREAGRSSGSSSEASVSNADKKMPPNYVYVPERDEWVDYEKYKIVRDNQGNVKVEPRQQDIQVKKGSVASPTSNVFYSSIEDAQKGEAGKALPQDVAARTQAGQWAGAFEIGFGTAVQRAANKPVYEKPDSQERISAVAPSGYITRFTNPKEEIVKTIRGAPVITSGTNVKSIASDVSGQIETKVDIISNIDKATITSFGKKAKYADTTRSFIEGQPIVETFGLSVPTKKGTYSLTVESNVLTESEISRRQKVNITELGKFALGKEVIGASRLQSAAQTFFEYPGAFIPRARPYQEGGTLFPKSEDIYYLAGKTYAKYDIDKAGLGARFSSSPFVIAPAVAGLAYVGGAGLAGLTAAAPTAGGLVSLGLGATAVASAPFAYSSAKAVEYSGLTEAEKQSELFNRALYGTTAYLGMASGYKTGYEYFMKPTAETIVKTSRTGGSEKSTTIKAKVGEDKFLYETKSEIAQTADYTVRVRVGKKIQKVDITTDIVGSGKTYNRMISDYGLEVYKGDTLLKDVSLGKGQLKYSGEAYVKGQGISRVMGKEEYFVSGYSPLKNTDYIYSFSTKSKSVLVSPESLPVSTTRYGDTGFTIKTVKGMIQGEDYTISTGRTWGIGTTPGKEVNIYRGSFQSTYLNEPIVIKTPPNAPKYKVVLEGMTKPISDYMGVESFEYMRAPAPEPSFISPPSSLPSAVSKGGTAQMQMPETPKFADLTYSKIGAGVESNVGALAVDVVSSRAVSQMAGTFFGASFIPSAVKGYTTVAPRTVSFQALKTETIPKYLTDTMPKISTDLRSITSTGQKGAQEVITIPRTASAVGTTTVTATEQALQVVPVRQTRTAPVVTPVIPMPELPAIIPPNAFGTSGFGLGRGKKKKKKALFDFSYMPSFKSAVLGITTKSIMSGKKVYSPFETRPISAPKSLLLGGKKGRIKW